MTPVPLKVQLVNTGRMVQMTRWQCFTSSLCVFYKNTGQHFTLSPPSPPPNTLPHFLYLWHWHHKSSPFCLCSHLVNLSQHYISRIDRVCNCSYKYFQHNSFQGGKVLCCVALLHGCLAVVTYRDSFGLQTVWPAGCLQMTTTAVSQSLVWQGRAKCKGGRTWSRGSREARVQGAQGCLQRSPES